ncbi:MAG: hypothetical protein E7602_06540 [Ruminococcaceae bacterium]|nr:hypothetical protein [Oscillospiraceae bacterium]
MKKKLLITALIVVAMVCMLAVSVSAAAPAPQKPTLDVDFGTVTYIDGFTAPSELYVDTTERFVLDLGDGNYVTYPTYYITKNQAAFDVDFGKLNTALGGTNYSKANIALLEIPEGITTINNSTFSGSGYAVCKYVQFPSTITTFGTNVFNVNKAIVTVEFVDGSEPLAIGDGMFSGAWNGGPENVQYVKFPNNCVSIGTGTFSKSYQTKTIIFGASLQTIGTGFFGESTPQSKETFIYASSNFFADSDMISNVFGGYDKYHNAFPKITLFYTGTQEEAQALIDKGLAVQPTGYIWTAENLTVVSASDYVYETHKPKQDISLTMVYNYNACDAFYNSVHENGAPTYDFAGQDYTSDFCENVACVNCGNSTTTKLIDPIFTTRGYSKSDDAFMFDMIVNADALAEYNARYPEAQISYGLVVSANNTINKLIGADGEVLDSTVLKVNLANADYKNIQVRLNNIKTDVAKAISVHACAYVIAGDKVSYIGQESTTEESALIAYNDIASEDAE